MNRERAKELLPFIEHYANGGEIECRHPSKEWALVTSNPAWLPDMEYRIAKPKPPEEIWVNCGNDGRGRTFTSKKQAELSVDPWTHLGVHYRRDDDE